MSKKKSRRSSTKYPALDPSLNLKTRWELIADCDYLDKLSEEDKDWLNRFNEEDINANFNHKGERISTDPKDVKKSYDRNNARNRCILTRAKAMGSCASLDELHAQATNNENPESLLIKTTDEKKK